MNIIEEIKAKFRGGRHAEALRECEQLCRANPNDVAVKKLLGKMLGLAGNFAMSSGVLKEVLRLNESDGEALFNIGVCERELRNFAEAMKYYGLYTIKFPQDADGWANLAECQLRLEDFPGSLKSAETAIQLNNWAAQAWLVKGDALLGLKRPDEALQSFQQAFSFGHGAEALTRQGEVLNGMNRFAEAEACFSQAIKLAPTHLPALAGRADALNYLGRIEEATDDYQSVLRAKPDDEDALKKVAICLVNLRRGPEAIRLCRKALEANPASLTAKQGISWLIDKIVPNWHVPMMNEFARNDAYFSGLKGAVEPDKLVFEIGAGSGLLSMMAAKLGAQQVVTCEGASIIAEMAQEIVAANGFGDIVKVLAKPSFEVELGKDLPRKADILVHEIFSSGLIEEHVLPAIEDAKQRLLAPGARIIPAAADMMIALVGGENLGQYLYVKDPFGFDIRKFNAITPKKLPVFRGDLEHRLMSDAVDAFHFDFVKDSSFPSEQKVLEVAATEDGQCYGIIQWIRLDMDAETVYENHPANKTVVSGWQHMVYRFDAPLQVSKGMVVRVLAAHDRAIPWFDLA